ncbi:hypothetical protein BJX62DRAFT_233964 [Aspergillus germanicus]
MCRMKIKSLFCMLPFSLQTNTTLYCSTVGVISHIHKRFYENLYCSRGRLQLWTQSNNSSADADAEQNTRVLTQGDFGDVTQGTIHTFQTLDPDTMFTVVIQPGGFEDLFLYRGDPATTRPSAPRSCRLMLRHRPRPRHSMSSSPLTIGPCQTLCPAATTWMGSRARQRKHWHNGFDVLPTDSETPFYIARGWGPKYLNSAGGVYKLIAPLQTEATSAGNLTMGTITMSPSLPL